MKRPFFSILFLCLFPTVSAFAGDALSYIMERSPELRTMDAQRKWYNQLSLKASARTGYGQSLIASSSADTTTIQSNSDQARSNYDLAITASMPIISPKETLDLRLKYSANVRALRSEAAAAIAKYQTMATYIGREESIIQDLRAELDWLKQREGAALEETKAVIAQTLEIKGKIRDLDAKRPELAAARENVLSFVVEEDRPKLRQILDGL